MAVYFLYYLTEEPNLYSGGWQSFMTRADQIIGIYGWGHVRIDPKGLLPVSNKWPIIHVRSLDEAIAHPELAGYQWVWLHPKAKEYLQDFTHPKDNVIYCVGDDKIGFEELALDALPEGKKLRILTPDSTREYFAETVLHLVVYDRALKTFKQR